MKSDIGSVHTRSPFGTFPGKLFQVEWQLFGEFLRTLFAHVQGQGDNFRSWKDGFFFAEVRSIPFLLAAIISWAMLFVALFLVV